jgi:hypothetical protein
LDVSLLLYAISFSKEERGKLINEIASENIKEETDDSEIGEPNEHFTKQFRN